MKSLFRSLPNMSKKRLQQKSPLHSITQSKLTVDTKSTKATKNRQRTSAKRSSAKNKHELSVKFAPKRLRESGSTPPNTVQPHKKAANKRQPNKPPVPEGQLSGLAAGSMKQRQADPISASAGGRADHSGAKVASYTAPPNTPTGVPSTGAAVVGGAGVSGGTTSTDKADVEVDQHNAADFTGKRIISDSSNIQSQQNAFEPMDTFETGRDAGGGASIGGEGGEIPSSKPCASYADVAGEGDLSIAIIDLREGDKMVLMDQTRFTKLSDMINNKLLSTIGKNVAKPKIEDSRLVLGATKIKCGDQRASTRLADSTSTI